MKAKRARKDAGSSARKSPTARTTKRGHKTAKAPAAPKGKTAQASAPEQSKRKEQVVFRKEPFKGTFNTHDIMHSPVEKTIQMLEKIISGERLFTM